MDTSGNKVYLLPKGIIEEINGLINKGHRAILIRKWFLNTHKEAQTPSLYTLRRYIKQYLKDPKEDRTAGLNVSNEGAIGDGTGLDTGGKGQILQDLLVKCVGRLNDIAAANENPLIPQIGTDDKVLKYTREIRATIEVMIKLGTELERDENIITKDELNNEIQDILYTIKKVVDKVCPEKAAAFAKALEEEMGG